VRPIFKAKQNAHIMCAQESSFHTYIYYTNNVLQKTKSTTLEDTSAERHHNSTDNRLRVIAHLELLIEVHQIFFSFWAAA
jgi:hypothetical protein